MVEIVGTHGIVNIEIIGVTKALDLIHQKGQEIMSEKENKIFDAAKHLQEEIQASIMEHRAEVRSVDTGTFANSITINKKAYLKWSVETDVYYAKFLEYGTIFMQPRMHFRNSLARNKDKVISIIKNESFK